MRYYFDINTCNVTTVSGVRDSLTRRATSYNINYYIKKLCTVHSTDRANLKANFSQYLY